MFRMPALAARVAGAAAAASVAAVVALAPAAHAATVHAAAPHAAPPGDNGDVKIHAIGTSFVDKNNEPHVCRFSVDAFNFDPNTIVTWVIDQQEPTGKAAVLSGTLTLKTGNGSSPDQLLPAGHYKLTWNFAGEKGEGKHKTFWSDCAGIVSPPPGSTVMSGTGGTIGTVTAPGMVRTPSGHTVPIAVAVAGKTLPRTGGDGVLPLAGAATGLALAGVVLVRRSRRGVRDGAE